MTSDYRSGVDSIKWTVYAKIARIYKHNGKVIAYSYDAGGNRISKTVVGPDGFGKIAANPERYHNNSGWIFKYGGGGQPFNLKSIYGGWKEINTTPSNWIVGLTTLAGGVVALGEVNAIAGETSVAAESADPIAFTYEGQTFEVVATSPYRRPANATNVAQRRSVNQPGASCITCGTTQGPFVADHIQPISIEYLSTGTIDRGHMLSLDAIQSQCHTCSSAQGVTLRSITRTVNNEIRNQQNIQNGQQAP